MASSSKDSRFEVSEILDKIFDDDDVSATGGISSEEESDLDRDLNDFDDDFG